LRAFVLLTTFFLENNDLIVFAVADDGCFDFSGSDFAASDHSVDLNLFAGIGTNRRHTKRLSALNRKLLSTCFNNCVTHLLAPAKDGNSPDNRKSQIIRKHYEVVKADLRSRRIFNDGNKWQIAIASGGVEAVADDEFVRHDKACVIDL